jgi:hypothetical protein
VVPQARWVMEAVRWVDNLKTDLLQTWATLKETQLEDKVSDLICLLEPECSQIQWVSLVHRVHLELVEHPILETSLVVVQQTLLPQEHQVASLTIEKLIKAFFHQSM